jgi:hypothetical protein
MFAKCCTGCDNPARHMYRHEQVRNDLVRSSRVLFIWGLPIALALFATAAWDAHLTSGTVTGLIWIVATAWIGVACFRNARRCGRVHCLVDGVLLPPLSLVALLDTVGVISLSWTTYTNIFWGVVVVSFLPECFGFQYVRRFGA